MSARATLNDGQLRLDQGRFGRVRTIGLEDVGDGSDHAGLALAGLHATAGKRSWYFEVRSAQIINGEPVDWPSGETSLRELETHTRNRSRGWVQHAATGKREASNSQFHRPQAEQIGWGERTRGRSS